MISLSYIYAKLVKKLQGVAIRNSKIDTTSVVYPGSNVMHSTIQKYTYCGYGCQISYANIGSFCSIAGKAFIGGSEHPISWVSTSPVFENVKHSGPSKRFSEHKVPTRKTTVIGHDVWIGYNVTVKQGVQIGNGAVIGAGSVVTKDVPAYAVVGGCPSKIIKYRFEPDIIDKLQDIQWWNLSEKDLEQVAPLIKEPLSFINAVKKIKNSNS